MKKLLLVLGMCLSASAYAQYGKGSMPLVGGKVLFTEIQEVPGKSKDALYASARLAVTEMFRSAQDVIQMDDKDAGIIVAKGINSKTSARNSPYVEFTLKIAVKDGKYKVDLTDFVYNTPPTMIGNSPLAATTTPAETLTDDKCLNKKGECKTTGYGMARRLVIDTTSQIFGELKAKMNNSADSDW